MKKIRSLLSSTRTAILIVIPGILALLLGVAANELLKLYSVDIMPIVYRDCVGSLVLFLLSISGIVIIVRKEIPAILFPVRGVPAVLIGILWVAFFWILTFVFLWTTFV